jgi:hypothetical protein
MTAMSDADNGIAGWSYLLLECEATQCTAECAP